METESPNHNSSYWTQIKLVFLFASFLHFFFFWKNNRKNKEDKQEIFYHMCVYIIRKF